MRTCLLIAASLVCGACSGITDGSSSKAKTYIGTYSATVVESTVTTSLLGGGTFPCTNTFTFSGTLTMKIDEPTGATNGPVTGSAEIVGTQVETAHGGGTSCVAKANLSTGWSPTLTGTTSDLKFDAQNVATNGAYIVTSRTSFTGALSGGTVTGVLGFSVNGTGTIGTGAITQSYTTTMNVTLR